MNTVIVNYTLACQGAKIRLTCGSIISGQRCEFMRMAAFSDDMRSLGRPKLFQVAISASSVRILSGSTLSDIGIGG